MIPNDIDYNVPKVLAICHKETQTNVPVRDSSNSAYSLPQSDECDNDKGTVKIFEFNQIVQESASPLSISIIKDTFSEETRTHSDTDTSPDEPSANRYRYCREVIKPYLRDYPLDIESDEQLVNEILSSVQEDFPDYQPCFDDFGTLSKNDPQKIIVPPCKPDKAPVTIKKSTDEKDCLQEAGIRKLNDKLEEKGYPPIIDPSSQTKSSSTSCQKFGPKLSSKSCICASTNTVEASSPTMDGNKNKDKFVCKEHPVERSHCQNQGKCKGSKSSNQQQIKKPDKDFMECPPPKKSGSRCMSHCEKRPECPTGEDEEENQDKQEDETKNPLESKSRSCSNMHDSNFKSIMEAHNNSIRALREAAYNAFGKVVTATKDAVTLISTESAKQLASATSWSKSDTCNRDKEPPKKCAYSNNPSVESIPGYSDDDPVDRLVGPKEMLQDMVTRHIDIQKFNRAFKSTSDRSEDNTVEVRSAEVEITGKNPKDFLHKVVEKMDSTITKLGQTIDKSKVTILRSSSDRSVKKEDPERVVDPGHIFSKVVKKVDSTISKLSQQIDLEKMTSVIKSAVSSKDEKESDPYPEQREYLHKMADKVDSTLTSIRQDLDKVTSKMKFVDELQDKKSPSESSRPPKQVTHVHEPSNSVFTTIKSKIYSMFCEESNNKKETPDSADSDSDSDGGNLDRHFNNH